jgi:hypothetical protein
MVGRRSDDSLPADVRRLVQETLEAVRAHPKHAMGQHRRRRIYQALWKTERGDWASRWLAILSGRRVEPIYDQGVASSKHAGDDLARTYEPWEGPATGMAGRMLNTAEQLAQGLVTNSELREADRAGELEDFYHGMLVIAPGEVPWYVDLVLYASYCAVVETSGGRPLQTGSSGQYTDDNGHVCYGSSTHYPDDQLAGLGSHAGDASLHAAYAYARMVKGRKYEPDKLLEFWDWWLTETLDEAWRLAASSPPVDEGIS